MVNNRMSMTSCALYYYPHLYLSFNGTFHSGLTRGGVLFLGIFTKKIIWGRSSCTGGGEKRGDHKCSPKKRGEKGEKGGKRGGKRGVKKNFKIF